MAYRSETIVVAKGDRNSFKAVGKHIEKEVRQGVESALKAIVGTGFFKGVYKGIGLQPRARPSGFMGKAGEVAGKAALGVGVFGMIAKGVTAMVDILAELFPPAKMFFTLFKAIGMLLFMPLIPVLIPTLKLLMGFVRGMSLAFTGRDFQPGENIEKAAEGIGFGLGVAFGYVFLAISKAAEAVFIIVIKMGELIGAALKIIAGIATFNGELIDEGLADLKNVFTTWKTPLNNSLNNLNACFETAKNTLASMIPKTTKSNKTNYSPRQYTTASGAKTNSPNPKTFYDPFVMASTADDFIMQPGGRLIKTNPKDTIMGFKGGQNPFSGGSSNITVNINNTTVRDERDIRELVRQVSSALQSQYRGKVSYVGGH